MQILVRPFMTGHEKVQVIKLKYSIVRLIIYWLKKGDRGKKTEHKIISMIDTFCILYKNQRPSKYRNYIIPITFHRSQLNFHFFVDKKH